MATNVAYQNKRQDGVNLTTSSLTDTDINFGSGHTYSNVCYGVIGPHTRMNVNMSYSVQLERPKMVDNVSYGIVGSHIQ